MLVLYGLVVGPSSGNFYAKDYLRGLLGLSARLGGGYLMLDAMRELAGDDVADALGWNDKNVSLTDQNMLIGGGIIVGSAIYTILSSTASVNRFNRKTGYTVQVTPGYQGSRIIPVISGSVHL